MYDYLINSLETIKFEKLITLLDYDKKLSDVLKSINLSSLEGKTILVDTALVSGMNRYRFIESKVTDEGYLNLNEYRYVDVDLNILEFANDIIRNNPNKLKNSILTIPQKNKINNCLYSLG
ncbi:MAG: type II toxin-antitoxin system RnlB family antitoxin [Tissierellaceae bacterium]